MADNTRTVDLEIAVKTAGEKAVAELATSIRGLGKGAGDAAPEFERLAGEIDRIGQQIKAVNTLSALVAEVDQLKAAQAEAAGAAGTLRTQLDALAATTASNRATEEAARLELQASQRALVEKRDALARLKIEYDAAGKDTDAYKSKVRELNLGILDTKAAIRDQRDALSSAGAATAAAADAEKRLVAQYDAAVKASRAADDAVRARTQTLESSRVALAEQGVATDNLAQAQADLVAELSATSAAADRLKLATDRLAASQRELADIRATAAQTDAAARLVRESEYTDLLAQAEARLAQRVRELADEQRAYEASLVSVKAATDAETKAQNEFAAAAERAARVVRESDYSRLFDELEVSTRDAIQAQKELEAAQRSVAAATEAETKAQKEFAAAAAQAARIVRENDYARLFDEIQAKADEAVAAEQRLVEATKEVDAAFKTLGIRNRAAIEGDINRIEAAMKLLGSTGALSGAEMERATEKVRKKVQDLKNEMDGVEPKATLGAKALGAFRSGLVQLSAAFGVYEAGSFVVKAVNELETMRRVLTLVTGSAETASSQIETLRSTANSAGVAVGDIQGAFSRFNASLLSAGVSLQTTNAVFASVTKAAGVLGLSSADAEASLRALGQMAAKGKVSMEELSQQLGERLPAVLSVTAKGLGLTTGDLTKLIETGKVLADEEFFAAFSRGVDKTFVEGAGKIEGMRAEFNRLLGTITEGVQVLAEGAFGKAIGAVLGGLGTSLQYILFGVAAISERFTVLGQTIGTVVSAVVNRDFANLGAALDDINKQSDDKLGNLAARISGISTASDSASVSVRSTAVVMEEGANRAVASAATQVQAATSVAQAHQAVAAAVTTSTAAQVAGANATLAAGEVSATAAASWTQLRNSYVLTQGAAEKLISQRTELVKAAKLEGDALLQVAAISGNEVLQREAAVAAAGKQAAAALALVEAEEALLGSQQRELVAMEEYIRINGDATGARQRQVVAQQQEVASIQAKVESARNEAASLDLTLTKRRLEIETIKDNSGRLGELRNAYQATRQALDDLRLQQQFGLATQVQVTAAEVRSAEAARMLSDAYHDLRASVELKAQSMRADLAISGAKLSAAQAEAQAAVKVAEATGDEVGAIQAKVKVKELEIAAVRSKVAAAQAEYQAEVDLVNAIRADLEQQGLLTPQKVAELDIRLRNAKAKLLEAQAGASAVSAIEAEIDALQRRNNLAAQPAGKAKLSLDEQLAADREKRLSGQNAVDATGFQTVQEKLRKGTLTADDAALVASLMNQVQQNSQINAGAGAGAISAEGLQSFNQMFAVAQTAAERIRQIEARDKAAANRQTQTTPAAPRTVNINIGGRQAQVNVASSADGDALVAMLRELESASNRSNGP